MRYANWLLATAAGASLSLSSVSWAQLKASAKDDLDVPKGKALGAKGDLDSPKGRSFVPARAPATAAATDRHETRRIPVINANAGATFRSTQLIGTNITDADGNMIGKVVDFVSDARGNILYPIVSYSGSAGFTGKLFAIPPSGLTFNAGANNATTAQFAFDPQLLKNAPSFSSTRFPDFSDQTLANQIRTFFVDILPSADPRKVATDPTVPANGPGDRVSTEEKAGTPSLPTDPTLPANGPGDRPAPVNPALPRTGTPSATTPNSRIPGTTGTENAGFPANPASSLPGGIVVGATGAPASASVSGSVAGNVQTANNSLMLRSSQMVGMSIQDNHGQTLGKVVDFVGDTNGNNRFAVVSLGSDGRNIILPYNALRFQSGANGSNFATLRVAPGQLKTAPSFTGTDFPDFTDQNFISDLQKFYAPLLPNRLTDNAVTTPCGSTSTPGGTRTPDWPSRPIPPGGPVPRPGPDGKFPTTTTPPTTTGSTTPTGPTTPGGSRSTPGGTRTPDFPSRPIPPGGPVPRPGPTVPKPLPPMAGPRIPAPGAGAPGVPGVPAPGAAAPGRAPGGAVPAGGGAPSGGAGVKAGGS